MLLIHLNAFKECINGLHLLHRIDSLVSAIAYASRQSFTAYLTVAETTSTWGDDHVIRDILPANKDKKLTKHTCLALQCTVRLPNKHSLDYSNTLCLTLLHVYLSATSLTLHSTLTGTRIHRLSKMWERKPRKVQLVRLQEDVVILLILDQKRS